MTVARLYLSAPTLMLPLTTIALVDDHQIVRDGLRTTLEAVDGFRVVGDARDGLEAIALAQALTPDVLVLDLGLPGIHGLEVLRRVRTCAPRTHVVILSMHADDAYVIEALRAGAEAYVLKEAGIEELLSAIRSVAAGHRYLSPPLSDRAIEAYFHGGRWRGDGRVGDKCLTLREREVLALVAQGRSAREIGGLLAISPRTVETHRSHLLRKLGLRSLAELIKYAVERGGPGSA